MTKQSARSTVSVIPNNARLSEDFGLMWAIRLFGEDAINSLPTYANGKNKGKPKGYVHWVKAADAGYCRDAQGVVFKGQVIRAWIGASHISFVSDALQGNWLGRVQPIGGSTVFLFAEGRAKEAARVAREKAEAAAYEATLIARENASAS